jgi:menaquinone-dependent protoporphyrinogen IX oxidase
VKPILVIYATREGQRRARDTLMYSKYNFAISFVMKRVARKKGEPTNTWRNYEFTDWQALGNRVRGTRREAKWK